MSDEQKVIVEIRRLLEEQNKVLNEALTNDIADEYGRRYERIKELFELVRQKNGTPTSVPEPPKSSS